MLFDFIKLILLILKTVICDKFQIEYMYIIRKIIYNLQNCQIQLYSEMKNKINFHF